MNCLKKILISEKFSYKIKTITNIKNGYFEKYKVNNI